MSVSVTRTGEVTRLTVTYDPDSCCPPLCQILRAVCCGPACCSVSRVRRGVRGVRGRGGSGSILGVLQVMAGLLTVGLGAIVCDVATVGIFPLWLGAVYFFIGVLCILSEKFPSPCLLLLSVTLHLFGSLLAATAAVMFSISLGVTELWWMCEHDLYPDEQTEGPPGATEEPRLVMEKCLEGKATILLLLRGITSVLLVLSMQQICVSVSSAVLGIKVLRSRRDGGDKVDSAQNADRQVDRQSAERPEECEAPPQGGGTDPAA